MSDKEKQIVFAIAPEGQGDGVPVVLLGIPKGAWDHMKTGQTNTFDLTKAGLPVKLITFGAGSHAEVMTLMNLAMDQGTQVDLGKDYSIKPK